MQPLNAAEQTRQGIADFLSTTFPATTHGFDEITKRFLEGAGNLAKGPYISIALPFRQQPEGKLAFEWLTDFRTHAHHARAFARLSGDTPRSTLVATGTGLGKTECFLYPVLEHRWQMRLAGPPQIKSLFS